MANPKILFLAIGTLLVCLVAAATGSRTRFIDDEPIDSIGEIVCRPTKGSQIQIGQSSTIKKLFKFFRTLPVNHKLKVCGYQIVKPLELLLHISCNKDDVCNNKGQISLIEQFHHRYISKTKKDRDSQKLFHYAKAPKILKYFFYHYVAQVATVCKNNLIEKVNEAKVVDEDNPSSAKVDEFLGMFSKQLGGSTSGSLKTYADISLFWSFIDRLPLREFNDYICVYEEHQRMTIETKDATSMQAFQRECLTRLRPVYGSLALPVIKLIDLGYYLDDEPFAKELASRADLRRLIGLAQACEFILPIIVSSNDKLNEGEIILLPVDRFTSVAPAEGPVVKPDVDFGCVKIEPDALITAKPDEAYQFVKSIAANIKAREKVMRNTFSRMASRLVEKAKSMFGKLFYKRIDHDKPEQKVVVKEVTSYKENLDLLRVTKNFAKDTLHSLEQDARYYSDYSRSEGLIFSIIGIPVLLAKWLFTILVGTIKGICLALYAVVVAPVELIVDKVEKDKPLIDKLI